jgi:hypothetical protein
VQVVRGAGSGVGGRPDEGQAEGAHSGAVELEKSTAAEGTESVVLTLNVRSVSDGGGK